MLRMIDNVRSYIGLERETKMCFKTEVKSGQYLIILDSLMIGLVYELIYCIHFFHSGFFLC